MKPIFFLLSFLYFSCSTGQTASDQNNDQPFDLPTLSYAEAGLNADSIDNLINLIYDTPHKDFRGLVVIKNNHLVVEEYFGTFWRNTIHDVRSAGKGVTALLLGIAIKDGLIKSLDQDVYSLFSKSKNPRKNKDYQRIKLSHLLDMSSGLDADSDNSSTPGQAGHWVGMRNWKEYVLNIPVVHEPGSRFVYADINPVLVGLAIEEAAGMSLRDYAKEKLFDPLGIEQFYWYTNSSDQTGAAGNLYISGLDFAKLGLLISNKGRWGNQQIIEDNYIDILVNTKNPDILKVWPWVDSYGLFWYKKTDTFNGKKLDYLYASGIGGNHLIVVPEHELVVAIISSAYGRPYQHGRSYAVMEKVFNAME